MCWRKIMYLIAWTTCVALVYYFKPCIMLLFLSATTYTFKIFPEEQTSLVNEGESFKFRCEYSNGNTKMNWFYKISVNENVTVEGYLPRNRITVLTNSKKSIEEYSIESVRTNDTGTYRCELTERGKKRTSEVRVLQVRSKCVVLCVRKNV